MNSIWQQSRGAETAIQRNMTNARKLWHDLGVIVIHPSTIENDWTRQALVNEANKQYGRRPVE